MQLDLSPTGQWQVALSFQWVQLLLGSPAELPEAPPPLTLPRTPLPPAAPILTQNHPSSACLGAILLAGELQLLVQQYSSTRSVPHRCSLSLVFTTPQRPALRMRKGCLEGSVSPRKTMQRPVMQLQWGPHTLTPPWSVWSLMGSRGPAEGAWAHS